MGHYENEEYVGEEDPLMATEDGDRAELGQTIQVPRRSRQRVRVSFLIVALMVVCGLIFFISRNDSHVFSPSAIQYILVQRSPWGVSTNNGDTKNGTSSSSYLPLWDTAVCADAQVLTSFLDKRRQAPTIADLPLPPPSSAELFSEDVLSSSMPHTSCTSEYWAVLTDQYDPWDTIHALLALPDQPCIVVVALHEKPPYTISKEDHNPQVVFLGPEEQARLPYSTVHMLPWGHLSRKNLGYLYAIHHGARAILDMEGSVVPMVEEGLFSFSSYPNLMEVREVYPAYHVFNPYSLVDRGDLRPRGMTQRDHSQPNSQVRNGSNLAGNVLPIYPQANIHILHSLIPDLPTSQASADINIDQFKLTSPPWSLPRNTFVPYNALSTLHRSKALFGLMLPASISTSMADTIRAMVTQRLLWEVGGYVALVSPWGPHKAPDKTTRALLEEEEEGNLCKIQAVVDYLSGEWQPDGQPLEVALRQVYYHLYKLGVVDEADVLLTEAWMSDLHRVSYQIPQVPPLAPSLPPSALEQPRFAVAAQGRASFLPNWVPIVDAVEGVDVFLLSFDEPIDPQVCNGPRVTCIFGEGASYANGRNLLAKSIYETEVAKGITYKYWMFGDQDIITTECDSCKGSGCGPTCIRDFVGQYLRSNESSPPVVAYAYPGSCMYPQWQSQEVWAVDAMFNGFHRQAVPFLLPYSTRLEQESWWESQIFLFYLWSACMGPNHPTVIASWCHYSLTDNQHSSYPRWKLVELQPTRRQYLDEEVGAHGIDLLTLDFPYKDDERITPETTIAFSGGSEDITWYSQNGKRWYESYEARLCTDRLHERFMSVMGA